MLSLNNPGNIEKGQNFQGEVPSPHARFAAFSDPEHGIRAMVRIFRSYERRGINTIAGIVSTWAPPNENDTEAYIAHVEQRTGIPRHQPVDIQGDTQSVVAIVAVMTLHENGKQPYDNATLTRGVRMGQA
jgi:hypothetical protein